MKLKSIFILLISPVFLFAQNKIERIINSEYDKGYFNGSVLYINKKDSIRVNKGLSNFQFTVEINNQTRFPIASMTKLFTTIAVLQLQEKGLVDFSDTIGKYIKDLSGELRSITIRELLLHYSGLENEPIAAVIAPYSLDEYINNFVKKSSTHTNVFNYNNVDYILLSKVIEYVTNKPYSEAIEDLILKPLNLVNSGFVKESIIIKKLAYGYHNYSFGEGDKDKPLYNDRRFLSNYYGAGAMYSSIDDLYQFIFALRDNKLIREETRSKYLLMAQTKDEIDWLLGSPTYGFFVNDKKTTFRRGGSIDGYNSELLVSQDFEKILIILCNTDTADLPKLATNLFILE